MSEAPARPVDGFVAGTIVARNYLPQARVLAESFLHHHPHATFVTLVLDAEGSDLGDVEGTVPGELVAVDQLGVAQQQWHQMAAIYSVMEFATAMKPAFLLHLLRQTPGATIAMYLDPDIVVRAPIDDVAEAAIEHGVALTPHVLQPMPRDGLQPDESVLRHAGLFNLGFIAVGASAVSFLQWWHERLVTDALVDLSQALFTDQRWIDWVPALYTPTVLRDPGLNVAYWNLHERPLTREGDVVYAGGSPLRFFHYSGYDPDKPWMLSKHSGDQPRVRLLDTPLLPELCAEYGRSLDAAGWADRAGSYGWAKSAGGVGLDLVVRGALRAGVLDAIAGKGELPPDPFDPAQDAALRAWLDGPAPGLYALPMSRWMMAFYESRSDVKAYFSRLDLDDAMAMRNWLVTDPRAVEARQHSGLPPLEEPTLATPACNREVGGWNLVGYVDAEQGVGEAARRLCAGLDAGGVPYQVVGLSAQTTGADDSLQVDVSTALRFRDSIYCVNADRVPPTLAALEHPHRTAQDARRIGLWFWELAQFRPDALTSLQLLEQVWVTSEFTRAALQPATDLPVHLITLPVVPPAAPTTFTREMLGLPEGPLFAFAFDFLHSVLDRKNPLGLVSAYLQAFPQPGEASLVLKTINGNARHPYNLDRIRHAIAGRPDIVLFDEHWSRHEMQALIELCDCYVSLHRSEGFGLTIADAMAAGRPVITTAYSGNMQFCDDDTALLVSYDLVPVGPDKHPYPADAEWAEPRLDVAAAYMRFVVEHPEEAAEVGRRAQRHIQHRQSPQRAAADIAAALGVPVL